MARRNKRKRGSKRKELKRKEAVFSLPLREFLLLFPGFPLPSGIDAFDPAYMVRFRPMPGGGVLTEIGYAEDSWMLE